MIKYFVLVLMLTVAVVMGLVLVHTAPKPREISPIEWLATPKNINDFTLVSAEGELNNNALIGYWTVVVFGYLNCPDICPMSLARLSQLAKNIDGKLKSKKVQFVFVSLDYPLLQLVDVNEYTQYFNQSFLGVTGELKSLRSLANSLGVRFKVARTQNTYSVSHSSTVSIIGPKGQLRGRFNHTSNVNYLTKQLLTYIFASDIKYKDS